jgi:hypothetical protein
MRSHCPESSKGCDKNAQNARAEETRAAVLKVEIVAEHFAKQ